jgi:hypothetical protein
MMAIIVPIALQGMGVVSRAAGLGAQKVAALRVAERILNEQLAVVASGQSIPTSGGGTEVDGGVSYRWTMQTEPWPQDTMTQMTVKVDCVVQGHAYEMSLGTLYDPNAGTPGTAANATTPAL